MSSKTNPRLTSLIADLKSTARDEVNLGRIERYARADETVIVPGKVLGSGALRKEVTVAAVDFSSTARTKIERAGEAIELEQALEDNPDGSDVRVIR
ncbi:50S ribosomal protein L18e [Halobacteriales archaeon QS_1_68_44]|nr:MAG: 50S ribosomal protein L18e [Halobacteriales archaeon QS_1_68_44]